MLYNRTKLRSRTKIRTERRITVNPVKKPNITRFHHGEKLTRFIIHSPGVAQPRNRPRLAAPTCARTPRLGHYHPFPLGCQPGGRVRAAAQRDPFVVPRHLDRGVVLGEALAVEPQLEVEVRGPDDGADLVRAVEPLLAPGQEAPGPLLELELAVLDAREVGPDGAELLCAGCCFFRCAVVSRRSSPLWQVDGVGCWEGMAYSLSC